MDELNRLTSELTEISKKKKQNLLVILNFTQLQTNAIEEQNIEKFNMYINEKQKHIDAIDTLDQDFVEKFNMLKTSLRINSLDEIVGEAGGPMKALRFELDGIYMLIEQISVIEKENSTKLKKEYDDIKGKLREINSGKRAINAYGSKPNPTGGAFFDSKK